MILHTLEMWRPVDGRGDSGTHYGDGTGYGGGDGNGYGNGNDSIVPDDGDARLVPPCVSQMYLLAQVLEDP